LSVYKHNKFLSLRVNLPTTTTTTITTTTTTTTTTTAAATTTTTTTTTANSTNITTASTTIYSSFGFIPYIPFRTTTRFYILRCYFLFIISYLFLK